MTAVAPVLGSLSLRIAIEVVMGVHGLGKLNIGPLANGSGIPGVAGFFGQLGIPLPGLFAWIVTLVEAVGGLLLLVGIAARVAAALVAVNMTVALVLVHLPNGFAVSDGGIEFVFVLALAAVAVALGGPGPYAVETAVWGRELLPRRIAEAVEADAAK